MTTSYLVFRVIHIGDIAAEYTRERANSVRWTQLKTRESHELRIAAEAIWW